MVPCSTHCWQLANLRRQLASNLTSQFANFRCQLANFWCQLSSNLSCQLKLETCQLEVLKQTELVLLYLKRMLFE